MLQALTVQEPECNRLAHAKGVLQVIIIQYLAYPPAVSAIQGHTHQGLVHQHAAFAKQERLPPPREDWPAFFVLLVFTAQGQDLPHALHVCLAHIPAQAGRRATVVLQEALPLQQRLFALQVLVIMILDRVSWHTIPSIQTKQRLTYQGIWEA